ncbi:MAG: hypothetical protein H6742_08515 [Alphaproteobacteria bacterium]|nr:hypothetical protein [Alphaproteobacteria bacterium]
MSSPSPALLLALLACTGTTAPAGDDTGAAATADSGDPGPRYTVDDPGLQLQWTAEERSDRIADALTAGLPDPFRVMNELSGLYGAGDEFCPGAENAMGEGAILGCTASTGTFYLGIGTIQFHEGDSPDGFEISLYMMGDMEIVTAEGERAAVGGHWTTFKHDRMDGAAIFEMLFEGSWSWEGSTTPWYRDGMSGWLDIIGERETRESTPDLWVDGVVGVGDQYIAFYGLQWNETCPDLPTGGVGVRDPSGHWYRVDLPEDCSSPCGPLMVGDELIEDEICLPMDVVHDLASYITGWREER